MPIDASIPLGVKPVQIESPVNALARVLQIQGLQRENELGGLKMDEYRRGVEEQNALRSVITSDFDWNNPQQRNRAFAASPTKAGALFKEYGEAQDKLGASKDRERKAAAEGYSLFNRRLGAHHSNPNATKADIATDVSAMVQLGLVNADYATKIIGTLPDDPVALRDHLKRTISAELPPEKMLEIFAPKVTMVDDGQRITPKDTNPLSPTFGQVTAGGAVQKQETPDARLSANTSTANSIRSTNASMANANATREVAAATKDAARITADGKARTDTELKLQDDYRTESKGWAETATAMKKVLGSIETADKNPGAALAAGTGFMKLLDPTSVVRESELGMALNASGWFDRATHIANTLQNGKTMTPQQKANLRSAAQDLFEEAKKAQLEVDRAYQKRAKDYGLDPARIIVDRGQSAPAASAPAAPGLPPMSAIDAELARRQQQPRQGSGGR